MSLSKNKIKLISSLRLKKYRDELSLFVAEGPKLVSDLLKCFSPKIIVSTQAWLDENSPSAEEIIVVSSADDLKSVTQLSSPSPVLAVFYKKECSFISNSVHLSSKKSPNSIPAESVLQEFNSPSSLSPNNGGGFASNPNTNITNPLSPVSRNQKEVLNSPNHFEYFTNPLSPDSRNQEEVLYSSNHSEYFTNPLSSVSRNQKEVLNSPNHSEYFTNPLSPVFFKEKRLILAIDSVQDPGNLGTIIRIADWFGINDIVCSETTVDVYNFKTIQATMGALCNVNIHYINLKDFCAIAASYNWPLYGTFLDGEVIYNAKLTDFGVIIMGNEGNGISSDIAALVSNRLYIPDYPLGKSYSESLNVAVATSIVCNEFRRLCYNVRK